MIRDTGSKAQSLQEPHTGRSRLLRIVSCERAKDHGLARAVTLLEQGLLHRQKKMRSANQQLYGGVSAVFGGV